MFDYRQLIITFKYLHKKKNDMLNVFSSKKGVSPLIATILLIAFAVALGSVVMNWGLNLNLGKSSDNCAPVNIKIRNIGGFEVCYGGFGNNGYINFIIDNVGESDLNGLSVWIVGEKGTRLLDIDGITIKKGSLFDKKGRDVTYDFATYGNIKHVQFIPKVTGSEGIEPCLKNAIKVEKIGVCS